jgi:hypothetical protein
LVAVHAESAIMEIIGWIMARTLPLATLTPLSDVVLRARRIRVRRDSVEAHGGFQIAQIPRDCRWAIELPPFATRRFETETRRIVRGMSAPFLPQAQQQRAPSRWRGMSLHTHTSSVGVSHLQRSKVVPVARTVVRSTTGSMVAYPLAGVVLGEGERMQPSNRWYVLVWVAPGEPSKEAYFVHAGPYETRDAAVAVAREARRVAGDDRFVRVIARAAPPTGEQWDDAEEIEPAPSQ